jgi:leader peptidase (prepilin peptidase)/N-methyltransferase
VIGSFLTVVAHRIPLGEGGIVAGRSLCPACDTQIAAYDNIPILSWLLLRGQCRYCKASISKRYPLTELATGLLFAGTVLALGTDDAGELVLGFAFCAVLVAITLTDLEHRLIPNKILLVGAALAVILVLAFDLGDESQRLIAAAAAGAVLFVVALLSGGMGMGDVKLVAMMGLYLGRSIAPALLIGFASGALLGAVLIARHGAQARKQKIPFGPFLALGGVICLWFGDEIVDWYLDSFTG